MSTATEFEKHPKTGFPIQEYPTFEVGDLVTEHIMSDGYPGVVVHATPKTVYVRPVNFVGNFSPNDAPGWNGYGDSGTIAIDPDDVAREVAKGKDGATKYVLRVEPVEVPNRFEHPSMRETEKYGGPFHRARWRKPGGYGSLSKGARYRQDPHV